MAVGICKILKSEIYTFISETARAAGQELSRRFGGPLEVNLKRDKSLVTEADLASERVILDRIRRTYPNDLMLSEESETGGTPASAGQFIWIVDPLDGTTNFANAYPFYCISIARCLVAPNGGGFKPVAGAVFDVPRQRLYYAEAGRGAWVDERRMHIAPPRPLDRSFLVTGFYYQQGDTLLREVRRFARVAAICQSIRRDGAAALDLALVADGVFDAFWELGLQPWDLAAGVLLVSEAGGVVCNYTRDVDYRLDGPGVIAGSSGAVRDLSRLILDGADESRDQILG